jgi:MFS family permease
LVTAQLHAAVSRLTARDACVALIYGIAGVVILTVQPLVFGPMVAAGHITESQLGIIAGIETAGLALASGVLPGWLSHGMLKPKMIGFAVVMLLCNLLTAQTTDFGLLIPVRLVCGLAEGGILAGSFVILFSGRNPERMNALFLAVSNIFIAALAYLLPTRVLPNFGIEGGFLVMAAMAAMSLLVVFPLRHEPVAMPMPITGWRTWPLATFFVFLGIISQNAAILAGWTFLESTARIHGYDASTLGLSASLNVLAQVAGATVVASFGYRLPAGRVLLVGSLVIAGAVYWLGHPGSALQFILANILMGIFGLALLPLSIKLIIEIERKRQAMYLTAAAQMVGLSIGPLIASSVVRTSNVEPAYVIGAALGVLAAVFFVLAARSPHRDYSMEGVL